MAELDVVAKLIVRPHSHPVGPHGGAGRARQKAGDERESRPHGANAEKPLSLGGVRRIGHPSAVSGRLGSGRGVRPRFRRSARKAASEAVSVRLRFGLGEATRGSG